MDYTPCPHRTIGCRVLGPHTQHADGAGNRWDD